MFVQNTQGFLNSSQMKKEFFLLIKFTTATIGTTAIVALFKT